MNAPQLLVRRPLRRDEGLRGFVSRLSDGNLAAVLFRPMMGSLARTTDALPEISSLSGERRDVLMSRGALVSGQGHRPDGCRFGDVVLSEDLIRKTSRAVCPICIAEDGVSLCVWELRAYDVCHRHGVRLVDTCGTCGQGLSWASALSRDCACGRPFAKLVATKAPASRARLCSLLAQAMLTSLAASPGWKGPTVGRALPIDWALLLIEFLSKVMLPRFQRLPAMSSFDAEGSKEDGLIVAMLQDHQYRDYVRDALFLHAAAEPMTLRSALRPGQSAEALRARFDPCWRELSFHSSLWQAKQHAQRNAAKRAVKRLLSAGVLRQARSDHLGFTARGDFGPPASWYVADTPSPVVTNLVGSPRAPCDSASVWS